MTNQISNYHSKRAIDNTIPQTAFAYFWNPQNPILEDNAKQHFIDFTNLYINTQKRVIPIPAKTRHHFAVDEPFIQLWQDDAVFIEEAAKPDNRTVITSSELVEKFVDALYRNESKAQWAKWIRFQWSPEIVRAYKSRVEYWVVDFDEALEDIKQYKENLESVIEFDSAYGGLGQKIDESFDSFVPDLEYRLYADSKNERLLIRDVAIAYAFSWFKRGASYRDKAYAIESSFFFHDLRNQAALSSGDKCSFVANQEDFLWGDILNDLLQMGIVSKHTFLDAIVKIRETVQNDGDCKFCVEKFIESGKTDEKYLKQTIRLALQGSGMPEEYKSSSVKDYLDRRFREFGSQPLEIRINAFCRPLPCEIIEYASDTKSNAESKRPSLLKAALKFFKKTDPTMR